MTENHLERGGYVEAVGRRKTAVARVRISKINKEVLVNSKPIETYFTISDLVKTAVRPLRESEKYKELSMTAVVKGGGITAQAEAIRHGLARACVKCAPEEKKNFKTLGLLTRDSRKKERKKFGLRKARKAPQWSKR